ncbi:MAG: hypothetical protein WCA10_09250 [Terracidiphilus sp.]
MISIGTSPAIQAQETPTPDPTAASIVQGMQRHDQLQSSTLQNYESLRHYSVIYKGFAKTITANMDVEVDYDASSGKSFRIISQKGSGMLCEKVLVRALDSEREASLDKRSTGLNAHNYRFDLIGTDRLEERLVYVLSVEPISPSKFLYEGKIWVDAADFAVAKMEVQPAKSPSFWISRTMIHHTNHLTNGFWLPEQNQSETKVRIGGTATMSIDYQSYRITAAPESSTTPPEAGTR